MHKQSLAAGSLLAMLAVILGAFGAHALKARMSPDMLAVFETGVRYQFYHAIALLVCGTIYSSLPCKQLKMATVFFIAGIVLFSGSLYAIALLSISGTSIGPAGVITPIGGLFFILGWLFLFLSVIQKKA